VEKCDEGGPKMEIIYESKDNDPEPTTEFEEEMTKSGSNKVDEYEGS